MKSLALILSVGFVFALTLRLPIVRNGIVDGIVWSGLVGHGLRSYAAGRSDCGLTQSAAASVESGQRRLAVRRMTGYRRVLAKDGALEQWDSPAGPFWLPATDRTGEFFNMIAEQQSEIYGQGRLGVHLGDVVLDCGANLGIYTRKALRDGARLVVAIDPDPLAVECFRRNLAEEIRSGRVIVVPKGVWDRDDNLQFHTSDTAVWGASLVNIPPAPRLIEVPVTTIDRIVADLGLPRVDLIKMDIEGAERRALAGAHRTVGRFRPRLAICLYHLPDDLSVIPRAVRSIRSDYRMRHYCYDDANRIRSLVGIFH